MVTKPERTPEREDRYGGYRERVQHERVGTIELRVPLVQDGTCSPRILDIPADTQSPPPSSSWTPRIIPSHKKKALNIERAF